MKASIIRKEHFNAAHRLANPEWTDEQNTEYFGKCANPNYHGHNYELYVKLTGEINPATGYVYDMKKLSDLIRDKVLKRFDHRNLNLDTQEFASLNPTAENIAVVIYQLLRPEIESHFDIKITLYETERNRVEFPV
jgi:6-pyruvoyltetrahydropterin/6-carboxytetrahydropterin synthase